MENEAPKAVPATGAEFWAGSGLEAQLESVLREHGRDRDPFWRCAASDLLAQLSRVVRLSRGRGPSIADVCWLAATGDDLLGDWLQEAQAREAAGRGDVAHLAMAESWKGRWDRVDTRVKSSIRRTLFLAALKIVDGSWSHTRES